MTIASYLDQQLRAANIPIDGVSVGVEADRTTWKVQYAANATAQHRIDGNNLVATTPTDSATLADADAKIRVDDKMAKAIVIWCAGKFGITNAQARSEVLAIFKALP